MSYKKEFTFDRVVRMIIALAFIVAAFWLVNRLKDVLLPFLVACLVAYLLEPFVQFNRRLLHLRGRIAAVFITLFETVFIVCVVCSVIGPMIAGEMNQMAGVLSRYANTEFKDGLIPGEFHSFLRSTFDFKGWADSLTRQEWMSILENVLQTSWNLISGSFSLLMGVFSWLIVLLYIIFVMVDYEKLSVGLKKMVPPAYRKTAFGIAHDVKTSMNRYFRGQATIAFIVGILFSIGFVIIGMPMAIVFGLFIGLLNLVPYLQLVSLIPAAVLCIISSVAGGTELWPMVFKCIAVYCIVQAIQDFYLTPRIMGKAMGLNPAIILLSLSVWGSLLGFIGLIIALPVTTLLISYYARYVANGKDRMQRERRKAVDSITRDPLE